MTQKLTIYLIREHVASFVAALSKPGEAQEVPLTADADIDGVFFQRPSAPRTPAWVGYLSPIVGDLDGIRTETAAGVFLMRASGRIFAITFGYGRNLLDLAQIEHQFGLRVVLNSVDPAQLRSLDTKTFDDVVVSTTRQVSRDAELPTFGVDISSDLLRAVTGRPRDSKFASRLSGSDALVVSTDRGPGELPTFCADLLTKYASDAYRSDFAWIDQLKLVHDDSLVDQLDQLVLSDLQSGELGSTHMAAPETLNWEDVGEFKIQGTRGMLYDELDLEAYLEHLGLKRSALTLDEMRNRKVHLRYSTATAFSPKWTIYRCLISEQHLYSRRFALVEGRWFEIAESLVQEIDQILEQVPEASVKLPPSGSAESEGAYNQRVADASSDVIKLDAKIKRAAGATSGIEVCDLFTSEGAFIHVKRKARSATLSHLFSQGTVSAETFLRDGTFRDGVRDQIVADLGKDGAEPWLELIPSASESPHASSYETIYAVVTNSNKEGLDWLPFFSKLTLVQATRRLQGLGFKVSVTRVPVANA